MEGIWTSQKSWRTQSPSMTRSAQFPTQDTLRRSLSRTPTDDDIFKKVRALGRSPMLSKKSTPNSKENVSSSMFYDGDVIKAANTQTLDGLIDSIVVEANTTISNVVLVTSRLIAPPNQFMARFIAKFDSVSGEEKEKAIQTRCVKFLSDWVLTLEQREIKSINGTLTEFNLRVKDQYPDFTGISDSLAARQKVFKKNAMIHFDLIREMEEDHQKEEQLISWNQAIPTKTQQTLEKVRKDEFKSTTFNSFEPEDIAKELTHLDLTKMKSVSGNDIVAYLLGKLDEIVFPHFLTIYYVWCDMVSQWVSSEICFQTKLKARVQTIEIFIEVAEEMLKLKNINGFLLIMKGLCHKQCLRLKKSFEAADNYKRFRELLEAKNKDPLCLAFLDDDLYIPNVDVIRSTLIESLKLNTFNDDKTLNFTKLKNVYDDLNRMEQAKAKIVCEPGSPAVSSYCSHLPVLNDSIITHYSNLLEPRKDANTMLFRYREALKVIGKKNTEEYQSSQSEYTTERPHRGENGMSGSSSQNVYMGASLTSNRSTSSVLASRPSIDVETFSDKGDSSS